ncbi:MAG: hypothetical protein H0U13_04590 [Gemmatimonadaceae bacterium]|nr:hypothetical protein [Gemmatimonadaceae bacterium]
MITVVRVDLAGADGAEVTEYLVSQGFNEVTTRLADNALVVEVASGGDLSAALLAFLPTAQRGMWRPPMPPALRAHTSHLRDFAALVRAGLPITNAQTLHALSDIIDWIRVTEDRL